MSKDVRRVALCVALRRTMQLQWQIGSECACVGVRRSCLFGLRNVFKEHWRLWRFLPDVYLEKDELGTLSFYKKHVMFLKRLLSNNYVFQPG